MSLFTRLARDSLWLLIARLGAQLCAVVVTYLLARRMGAEGFGQYSFIAAAILIGNTITTFGTDMVLIREIAAKSELSRFFPALHLQIVLSCLFIGFVFWLAPHLPNQTPESMRALRAYSLALIPLAFFTVFTSALRGAQKMGAYARLNLLTAALQVIVISIFIQRGSGVTRLAYWLLAIQVVGALAGGILCAVNFPGFWRGWRFSLAETAGVFFACLPVAIVAALGIVYQKLSLTALSLLGTASMAGWFSAAARVVEAARTGHFAAFTALYPAMANAYGNKTSSGVFRISWAWLLIAAGGAALLLFFLAEPIVRVFFGLEYRSSIPVLRILSFTLLPYTVNTYLSLVFLVERRERTLIPILIVSVVALMLLNLWLIPSTGEAGAGWSFLLAESLQACLLLFRWNLNVSHSTRQAAAGKGVPHELSDLSR